MPSPFHLHDDSRLTSFFSASAAKDAVGDKIDESKHDFKGEGYKEQAKH